MDVTRFPIASAYLAALPAGEASYPQCLVKGSVLRQIMDSAPVPFPVDELPPSLAEVVRVPPLPNEWVSEVRFNAVMLAHEDVIPTSIFREWVYSRNRALFSSSLYRILFLVVSPERLLNQMSSRWAAFRKGTDLAMISSAANHFVADVRYPPFLYDKHVLSNMTVAVTAALEAAGAHNPRVTLKSVGETSARFDIRWS